MGDWVLGFLLLLWDSGLFAASLHGHRLFPDDVRNLIKVARNKASIGKGRQWKKILFLVPTMLIHFWVAQEGLFLGIFALLVFVLLSGFFGTLGDQTLDSGHWSLNLGKSDIIKTVKGLVGNKECEDYDQESVLFFPNRVTQILRTVLRGRRNVCRWWTRLSELYLWSLSVSAADLLSISVTYLTSWVSPNLVSQMRQCRAPQEKCFSEESVSIIIRIVPDMENDSDDVLIQEKRTLCLVAVQRRKKVRPRPFH